MQTTLKNYTWIVFGASYVDKPDVQFSGSVASLQVPPHVDIIVTDDACDEV